MIGCSAIGKELRHASFQGSDHVVVPVVALVEGVLQAMNADGPELVLASEFSKTPQGWNGRPVVPNHPAVGNDRVSANSPGILEANELGRVFNTKVSGNKLLMEAWIDPEKAKKQNSDILDRLASGKTVEVSVGVFVSTEEMKGAHNGESYDRIWRDIVPDHLAMLPEGMPGACSIGDGCGAPRMAGGKGSGDFGHKGRPGEVGGSGSGGGSTEDPRDEKYRGKLSWAEINDNGLTPGEVRNINTYLNGKQTASAFDLLSSAEQQVIDEHQKANPGEGQRKKSAEERRTDRQVDSMVNRGVWSNSSTDEEGKFQVSDKEKVALAKIQKDYARAAKNIEKYGMGRGHDSEKFGKASSKLTELVKLVEKMGNGRFWLDDDGIVRHDSAQAPGVLMGMKERIATRREERLAGGKGSGDFGHKGRPGEVGGSGEGGGNSKEHLEPGNLPSTATGSVAINAPKIVSDAAEAAHERSHGTGDAAYQHWKETVQPTLDKLNQLIDGKEAVSIKGITEASRDVLSSVGITGAKADKIIAELLDRGKSTHTKHRIATRRELRAACGCDGSNGKPSSTKETAVTKEERVKALMAKGPFTEEDEDALLELSDSALTCMETHVEPLVVEKVVEKIVEVAKKPLTEEEYLDAAPDSIKTIVSEHKAAAAKRHLGLVKQIKTLAKDVYTDDELTAMPADQLDKVLKVAAASAPKKDFSGGAPRAASAEEEDNTPPAPIDMNERLRLLNVKAS